MAHERLIKENVAPQGAAAIGVVQNGTVIGQIPLGTLAHTYGTKLFSFGLLSDVHLQYTNGNDNTSGTNTFKKILQFYNSYSGLEFITLNGDITIDQQKTEYDNYKSIITNSEYNVKPVYMCTGNHDMGFEYTFGATTNTEGKNPASYFITKPSDWKTYNAIPNSSFTLNYNSKDENNIEDINYYFSYTKGNKKFYFIFLSCKHWMNEYCWYDASDVTKWLTTTLNTCSDGQCFVYVHCPPADRCNFGYDYKVESVLRGNILTKVRELSRTYKNNTIWFHGHTHWAWENQGKEWTNSENATALGSNISQQSKGFNLDANVYPTTNDGRTSGWHVHTPSTIQAKYYYTEEKYYEDSTKNKNRSQFAVVDVYADHVIIKGLSFDNTDDNSTIKYLPIAQYKLDYATEGGSSDSGSTDTGGSTGGGSTTTSSYIDETNKIIYGFVGETLDLGWTPDHFRAQNYEIFGASSNTLSYSDRITMSGSKMSFIGTANKNWSSGISGSVEGLASSSNESGCWFWTYKTSEIKYKTIIKTATNS